LPTRSSSACAEVCRIVARAIAAGVALAGLVAALPAPGLAQIICGREGDRLNCSDGRTYRIYPEPWSPRSLRERPGLSSEVREDASARHPLREPAEPPDATRLYGPDGLVCWPHRDHAHCTRAAGPHAPSLR
jgi:hypothetical protein